MIWPYTDMLLHDMGEALGDELAEGTASGREWRTPPLWGIGLTKTVSGHEFMLHDGRARSIEEAILWHGGEGLKAREGYLALTQRRTGLDAGLPAVALTAAAGVNWRVLVGRIYRGVSP